MCSDGVQRKWEPEKGHLSCLADGAGDIKHGDWDGHSGLLQKKPVPSATELHMHLPQAPEGLKENIQRGEASKRWHKLRTGMQGAFGKSQGTVARVRIAQVIMSICTKLQNKEHMIEALRRAKFKFPGHQKIHISKKWGFIKFNADAFEDMVAEKQLIPDGCGVKYIPSRGPRNKWRALHS
nr:60S ribosomal protein L10-like [Macaca fascicularis]